MITIHFDFKEREAEDLEQLNALLATMQLEELELQNLSGYLAVTRDAKGCLLGKRYGLDSGSLVCRLAQDGDQYRLESAVARNDVDEDAYLDRWREAHPDRVIRIAHIVEFKEDYAYIIAHHRKPE